MAGGKFPIEVVSREFLLPPLLLEVDRLLGVAVTREHPHLIHMLGIPGSGKSGFVDALIEGWRPWHFSLLGFDRVMKTIPAYQTTSDRQKAFKHYEGPAREAGYFILRELLAKRADLLFDHSGHLEEHLQILHYAKDCGYTITVIKLLAEVATAERRVSQRQNTEGRYTPLCYISEREQAIRRLTKKYENVADVYFQIENNRDRDTKQSFDFFAEMIRKQMLENSPSPQAPNNRRLGTHTLPIART